MPDSSFRYEVASSDITRKMLPGANIQASYMLNYSIEANLYISARLSFRWSTPLVWCLGHYSCIYDKFSGEVSDVKLSKNIKAMFIFKTKLVCQFN